MQGKEVPAPVSLSLSQGMGKDGGHRPSPETKGNHIPMNARELFERHFQDVSESEWQSWLDEMADEWKITGLTDRELFAVVKDMSANEKDYPKRSGIRELMKGIWSRRRRQREIQKDFESPMPICSLCGGSGMLQASWETNALGMVILFSVRLDCTLGYVHGNGSVPCMCSRGQRHQAQQHCPENVLRKVQELHRQNTRHQV